MVRRRSRSTAAPARSRSARLLFPAVVCALASLLLLPATPALAGQASAGDLLFYPCTSCHPVTDPPSRALPGGFKGHEIVLEAHDALGKGEAACLACHDDPTRDPGKLKLVDGSLVDIKGDVSRICYRCHSAKYKEWKTGTHGKHKPKCTSSGCHDPHTPGYIYAGPLLPFVGTGFQFKVLSRREAFSPLAPPPVDPAVEVPPWFAALAAVVLVVAAGQLAVLLRGRQKR